jgi:hypothetical protein
MRTLRYTGFGLLVAIVAGWIFPGARLWSVHFLAFLPTAFSLVLIAIAVVLMSPLGARVVASLSRALQPFTKVNVWVWVALSVVVFIGMRESEPLLGDGQLLLRHLAQIGQVEAHGYEWTDEGFMSWREPLETLIHERGFRAVAGFHPPPIEHMSSDPDAAESQAEYGWFFEAARWSYIVLSTLAGGLFLFALIRFCKTVLAPEARAVFFLAMLCGGIVIVFFGYAEDYSYTALAIVATLLLGIQESLSAKKWPVWTLAAFGATALCHLGALYLLPAVLMLVLTKQGVSGKIVRWIPWAFVVASAIGYVLAQPLVKELHILPISPVGAKDGYSILTLARVVDILNLLVLIAPLSIFAFWKMPGHAKHKSTYQFLRVAAVGGIGLMLVFNPELGAGRDWDISGLMVLPLLVLAAWSLSQRREMFSHTAIATLAAIVLLTIVPFAAVNAQTQRSLARFETLLHLDHDRSSNGWEILAAYYRRQDDHTQAIRALQNALEVEPDNPRFQLNLAGELRKAGRLAESEPLYLEAARARKGYAPRLLLLCRSYNERGDNQAALRVARELVVLSPDTPHAAKVVASLEKDSAAVRTKDATLPEKPLNAN